MKKEYLELGEKLKYVLQDTIAECDGVEQIQVDVINDVGDRLVYGLSIVNLHDAYYLFGSTFGGGYEFIEHIEEDDIEEVIADVLSNNFNEMDLRIAEL